MVETVMSHQSKVDLLEQAQNVGYRTYLYFVATEDPSINVSRVVNRVKMVGHDVPEEKIIARYHRSLELLMEAIRHTNRAYVFDNSGNHVSHEHTWLAEITEGKELNHSVLVQVHQCGCQSQTDFNALVCRQSAAKLDFTFEGFGRIHFGIDRLLGKLVISQFHYIIKASSGIIPANLKDINQSLMRT